MFNFIKVPKYSSAKEAIRDFLANNNLNFECSTASSGFRMLADTEERNHKETTVFNVLETLVPPGALATDALRAVIMKITVTVWLNENLSIPTYTRYLTNFDYKIEKPGHLSNFYGPEKRSLREITYNEEIIKEYNRNLKELFTDLKHAINPVFWEDPEEVLKAERKAEEK